jgi:hypothetical protein
MSHPSDSRFRSEPGLMPLVFVLSIKFRLLCPPIWKSCKFLWTVKPLLFGVVGMLAFGFYEVKKNTLDRVSQAIRNAAVQEAYDANDQQASTYENERWYEFYLDAFHYVPNYVCFLFDGRESELEDPPNRKPPAAAWVHFGPEPGVTPFLGALHVEFAHMMRDLSIWNFVWPVSRPAQFLLPWAWHDADNVRDVARTGEPLASLRLRFLEINAAFGRYVGGLNGNRPRRTPYIQELIKSGQLHLTVGAQRAAEFPASATPAKGPGVSPQSARGRPKKGAAVTFRWTCTIGRACFIVALLFTGRLTRSRIDRRAAGRKAMAFDTELEAFKHLDLRAIAASHGYEIDKRASWSGSAVMRHANDDKIIISRDLDGHYVYYSVRDDRDHGTAIDFLQRRLNLSLGAVRKELRPWLSAGAYPLPAFNEPLVKTPKDRLKVQATLAGMSVASRHAYLEIERGIPAELLQSPRFFGCVWKDERGNAIFPHTDDAGVCGYEMKNRGAYTSFSSGGSKGLWLSNTLPEDNRLVFCESAIDALSYAALFPAVQTRLCSIGGKPNPFQPELIRIACARMPYSAEVAAAMDADAAGRELAELVRHAVLTGRADLRYVFHEPEPGTDWNDVLRAKRGIVPVRRPGAPIVA